MATHDYAIANASGATVRADLNSALAAIVSRNSNATAPATLFADMVWFDTTTKLLKQRNEANTAWIVLGLVDQTTGFRPYYDGVAIEAADITWSGEHTFDGPLVMGPETELTIASGAITPTGNYHTVDTESDAASDALTDIATTNVPDGGMLLLRAINGARTVVVTHTASGAGKIVLSGAADFAMDDAEKSITLQRRGDHWEEISRSFSTSGGATVTEYSGTDTHTWDAGLTIALLEAWGAGAGGGSGSSSSGGAGGGGYLYRWVKAADLGASDTITIGAGGAANVAGGNTTIGSLLTAYGAGEGHGGTNAGGGGGGGALSAGEGSTSSTGGTGGSPGDDSFGGGEGGLGQSAALPGDDSGYGGGGGGGGGVSTGGDGGDAVFGGGGGGGGGGTTDGSAGTSINGGDGADGGADGGGGGGGPGQNASTSTGGGGFVRITEYT